MRNIESEEINLLDILASLYATVKRHLLLAILLPLIGAIIAVAIIYNSRDRIQSSLLIETSLLSKSECKFLFDQLGKSGMLPGLTKEEQSVVAGFKFEVIEDNSRPVTQVNPVQRVENAIYVEVTATVYDQKILPRLQNALINFISQSPTVARQRADGEKYYGQMIERIDREIAAMEGVKKQVDANRQATYLNPSELYSKTVDLFKEKIHYEIAREEIKEIHLIKPFDTLTINAKMSNVLAALIGLGSGFILFWIIVFLLYFGSYYRSHPRPAAQ